MPFLLLMPSYNQAHYIGAAIDSVLAQDDPDWQLWILDNSSDDTAAVVAARADPRIRFRHEPVRMDPGTCLNRMLGEAEGHAFSYVHTDNVLYPSYVRRMREALAGAGPALAYCDMRLIDARGVRTGLFRRGAFDLARLFGPSPLGVPFAATTDLARVLGGFGADDVVDDVAFCTRAYGLASYRYLRGPLLDYRVHEDSRTSAHGAHLAVRREFLRTFRKVLPELEARGHAPIDALRAALAEACADLRMAGEDTALFLGNLGVRWWDGTDFLDALWRAGVLRIADFERRHGAPGRAALLTGPTGGWRNRLLLAAFYRGAQKRFDRTLQLRYDQFRGMLLSLAWLTFGEDPPAIRAGSSDVLTLWGCAVLAEELGWRFELSQAAPARPVWPRGSGEPRAWIDLSGRGSTPAGVPALVL